MADQAVMEKLLQVLNQIDDRLAQIEQNTSSGSTQPRLTAGQSPHQKPDTVSVESLPKDATSPPGPDLHTKDAQSLPNEDATERHGPVEADGIPSVPIHDDALSDEEREIRRMKGNRAYFNAQPYEFQDFSMECRIEKRYHGKEAEALWADRVGRLWSLPPDNRIDLSFQRHILETASEEKAKLRLASIAAWYQNTGGSSGFTVQDYDRKGQPLEYDGRLYRRKTIWETLEESRRYTANSFDFACNIEELGADISTERTIGRLQEPAAWRRLM